MGGNTKGDYWKGYRVLYLLHSGRNDEFQQGQGGGGSYSTVTQLSQVSQSSPPSSQGHSTLIIVILFFFFFLYPLQPVVSLRLSHAVTHFVLTHSRTRFLTHSRDTISTPNNIDLKGSKGFGKSQDTSRKRLSFYSLHLPFHSIVVCLFFRTFCPSSLSPLLLSLRYNFFFFFLWLTSFLLSSCHSLIPCRPMSFLSIFHIYCTHTHVQSVLEHSTVLHLSP